MTAIEHYRSQIEAALKYGGHTHTFEDVARMVEEHDAQIWTTPDSFIITQVLVYPQKKVVLVWLAGGKLPEIEEMTPRVVAWAKAEGCSGAMLLGRAGWERTFLANTGWTRTMILMETTWQAPK